MGKSGEYQCLNCGNIFEASEGGGFRFEQYRCVNCDKIKEIELKTDEENENRNNLPKSIVGVCKKCGGELRNDLKPMCPKCKSRDVVMISTSVLYD